MDSLLKHIGENIKDIRIAMGESVKEFAKNVGINPLTLTKIEQGANKMTLVYIEPIAEYTCLSVDEVLRLEDYDLPISYKKLTEEEKEEQRKKARERYHNMSEEERAKYKERQRIAGKQYREKNRKELAEYRRLKRAKEREEWADIEAMQSDVKLSLIAQKVEDMMTEWHDTKDWLLRDAHIPAVATQGMLDGEIYSILLYLPKFCEYYGLDYQEFIREAIGWNT